MFTGRPRRAVNLGSKKQASTHDVLKNAEFQRQKREKQRKESSAILNIQSRWRASKTLSDARMSYAQSYLDQSSVAFTSADQFAWIIPALPHLETNQQVELIHRFVDSPISRQYSKLLIDRLPILCGINDIAVHALAVRVLQFQSPPIVPVSLLASILQLDPKSLDLEWLATKDPYNFLHALLTINSPEIISTISLKTLEPLFALSEIPPTKDSSELTIRELLLRLIPQVTHAWRLIFAIVLAMDKRHIPNMISFAPELCARDTISSALMESPLFVANYIMALLHIFARSKPTILLQLSLASSPSPLTTFWSEFKATSETEHRETLLQIATELYSYWLLVATDAELVNNTSLGLNRQDLWDFATTIRDRSFDVLWRYMPNQRTSVSGTVASILKVLRQLYIRDSRMHLFPPGFWLMDSIPQTQFVQNIENADSLFGMGQGFDTNADDEDDEEDEEEDEDESGASEIMTDNSGHVNTYDRLKEARIKLKPSAALRILEYAPFFVPFETRVSLFYKFINKDRAAQPSALYNRHHFEINRETLVEDAQLVFASLGPRVKTDLQVRLFSNGVPEAGVDGGGLTRELLMCICDEIFHKQLLRHQAGKALNNTPPPSFIETLNHTLAPNPVFGENPNLMTPRMKTLFFFLGQVIGKCLYENLLVDVEFAPFFLSKWNKSSSNGYSIKSSFDDLSLLDRELYHNISKLHNIHGNEVASLGLDFTVVNSQRQIIDLKPNGSSIPVTDVNKLEFMRELANYKLNTSLRPQTTWFVSGLSQVIRLEWLNMFNPQELNKLISGESQDFDVEDLKRNTEIFGFDQNSPTIKNLWAVLAEFKPNQRADFLKFITSVPKAPLLGFSRLEPRLGIRFAGFDDYRLPTSSTCVNLLKLPEYSSKDILRGKLLYSIEAKAGFELS